MTQTHGSTNPSHRPLSLVDNRRRSKTQSSSISNPSSRELVMGYVKPDNKNWFSCKSTATGTGKRKNNNLRAAKSFTGIIAPPSRGRRKVGGSEQKLEAVKKASSTIGMRFSGSRQRPGSMTAVPIGASREGKRKAGRIRDNTSMKRYR